MLMKELICGKNLPMYLKYGLYIVEPTEKDQKSALISS